TKFSRMFITFMQIAARIMINTQRFFLSTLVVFSVAVAAQGQSSGPHGRLTVAPDGHYLQYEDGTPFFWLGDTAWELFHRLTREEIMQYFDNRKEKGFNVIQAVVLAEMDGLYR